MAPGCWRLWHWKLEADDRLMGALLGYHVVYSTGGGGNNVLSEDDLLLVQAAGKTVH